MAGGVSEMNKIAALLGSPISSNAMIRYQTRAPAGVRPPGKSHGLASARLRQQRNAAR